MDQILGLDLKILHTFVAVITGPGEVQFYEKDRFGISPGCHGLNYATAAIEGGQELGGMLLFAPENFERLLGSGDAMGVLDGHPRPRYSNYLHALRGLYRRNRGELHSDAAGNRYQMYFRPVLFEASVALGVASSAGWAITIVTRDKTPYLGEQANTGVTIWAPGPQHFRRPDSTCGLASHKVSASYALGYKWKNRAIKIGAVEVVQYNLDNNVAETTGSNIFIVKGDLVFTPELDGSVLPGINRRRVIDLLRAAGYNVIECQVTPAMFVTADEIFVTGTWAGVVPVRRVLKGWPDVTLHFEPKRCVGPVTALAMELHNKLLRNELCGDPRIDGFVIDPCWYTPAMEDV